MTHELKILPDYFDPIMEGTKTFEVRKNDRDFNVGDDLWLREWTSLRGYTGRETCVEVSYLLSGNEAEVFGLKEGYCVMGIRLVE